jgi:hypothetical protein
MPIVAINLSRGATNTLLMKLDLDPNRPNEVSVLSRLESGAGFEIDVANAVVKTLRTGDIVADIGANAEWVGEAWPAALCEAGDPR